MDYIKYISYLCSVIKKEIVKQLKIQNHEKVIKHF